MVCIFAGWLARFKSEQMHKSSGFSLQHAAVGGASVPPCYSFLPLGFGQVT
jgi:hypothetical protein